MEVKKKGNNRVIVTLYTPGISSEPDQNSISIDEGTTHIMVPCWDGCIVGQFQLPDGTCMNCNYCKGTGVMPIWLL